MINSFDVFDTLMVRWYKEPDTIFKELESEFGIPDFVYIRKTAEHIRRNETIESIYESLKQITNLDSDLISTIMNREIDLEIKMAMPIQRMLDKVKDGDLIISDMYLGEENVSKILNKIGLKSKTINFVTLDGKSNGWIWNGLKTKYNINCHFGDNRHSDILMASNNGISNELVEDSNFTQFENELSSINRSSALISRVIRLSNPYEINTNEYNIWNEASKYTVPLNCLLSVYVNENFKNYKKLLFSTRDCINLFNIYNSLYPNDNRGVLFQTSRLMYYKPSSSYLEYTKNLMDEDSLIIDLQGSGNSFNYFSYHNKINSNLFLVVDFGEKLDNKQSLFDLNEYKFSDKIERVNYSTLGHLVGYEESPIREKCEYPQNYIQIYLDCINLTSKLISEGFKISNDNLKDSIQYILKSMEGGLVISSLVNHKDNLHERVQ